jgi:hypothetical protein
MGYDLRPRHVDLLIWAYILCLGLGILEKKFLVK